MNQDAKHILDAALRDALPGAAVGQALDQIVFQPGGRLILVAAGKAAWEMARAAHERLGGRIDAGVVVTKYDYSRGPLGRLEIYEAGHPVPDENSYRATARALEVVSGLTEADSVLFLLSGGGSALFEQPLIPADELADITRQLLACGANIVEINTLRKRLSTVKGGRFALRCMPAHVYAVVLSDIIGDPLDMIASGPAYPDASTCAQALEIADRYGLRLSDAARGLLAQETPKELTNVTTSFPTRRSSDLRAPAVPHCGGHLPGAGLRAGVSHRESLLRGARGRLLPGGYRPRPSGHGALAGLPRRR